MTTYCRLKKQTPTPVWRDWQAIKNSWKLESQQQLITYNILCIHVGRDAIARIYKMCWSTVTQITTITNQIIFFYLFPTVVIKNSWPGMHRRLDTEELIQKNDLYGTRHNRPHFLNFILPVKYTYIKITGKRSQLLLWGTANKTCFHRKIAIKPRVQFCIHRTLLIRPDWINGSSCPFRAFYVPTHLSSIMTPILSPISELNTEFASNFLQRKQFIPGLPY